MWRWVGNVAGFTCSGKRVHCTSRNLSGTCSSSSPVSSITTGTRNALWAVIRCERSTASFHSSRKYPSGRSWVRATRSGRTRPRCRRRGAPGKSSALPQHPVTRSLEIPRVIARSRRDAPPTDHRRSSPRLRGRELNVNLNGCSCRESQQVARSSQCASQQRRSVAFLECRDSHSNS